ncbi:UNVERIFIED_CONTAM: hypothetical protein HDU68_004238, partial [Siphonaria sp. JEL0065]
MDPTFSPCNSFNDTKEEDENSDKPPRHNRPPLKKQAGQPEKRKAVSDSKKPDASIEARVREEFNPSTKVIDELVRSLALEGG